jgi:hypothetical protein
MQFTDDLEHEVELGQRGVATHKESTPNERANASQDDAQLIDVGGWLVWFHEQSVRRNPFCFKESPRNLAVSYATHLVHHVLRRALRQAIRPRIQRHRRLHPGTIGATGDPLGPWGAGQLATPRAPELMPLIRGDHRLARGPLDHVMTPRLGVLPRSGRVAVQTRLGLSDHHRIDVFHRDEEAGRARMPRLTTTASRTPRPRWTFVRGWIARRRTGGVP